MTALTWRHSVDQTGVEGVQVIVGGAAQAQLLDTQRIEAVTVRIQARERCPKLIAINEIAGAGLGMGIDALSPTLDSAIDVSGQGFDVAGVDV